MGVHETESFISESQQQANDNLCLLSALVCSRCSLSQRTGQIPTELVRRCTHLHTIHTHTRIHYVNQEIYFKELAYVIVGTRKSKICMADQHIAGSVGEADNAVLQ